MKFYSNKKQVYFTNPRLDLISLIPKNSQNKILEVGAGGGDTLIKIKEMNLASEVVGLEYFNMPDTQQDHPSIDKMIIGNIETINLDFPANYFDVIICGDVLEHLFDPWTAVSKLALYLKEGGLLIVSIPNIREYKTLYQIVVKGDFRYADSGILDKTHIKFFCRKNVLQLVQPAGLKVIKVLSNLSFAPTKGKMYYFNKLTFNLFYDFFVIQFITVSQKQKS